MGIFGGSFNPIHNGHIAIARRALEQTAINEVWFMVSPQNPLKQHSDLLDDSLRLALVERAIEGERGMRCSDYEFRLPQPSYMWRTLQALSADYPHHTFALLIGADNWLCFDQWRNSGEILANHELYIYPRRGYDIDPHALPPGVTYLDMPLLDISATELRERMARGDDIADVTPRIVSEMMNKTK